MLVKRHNYTDNKAGKVCSQCKGKLGAVHISCALALTSRIIMILHGWLCVDMHASENQYCYNNRQNVVCMESKTL